MKSEGSLFSDIGEPLIGPEADWKAQWLRPSAWLAHVPFAFWAIKAMRPSCFVELGTHWGVSYFAFCQAVERLGLATQCFAVDTWVGDEHAGEYGGEVFADVQALNDQKYKSFSSLLRCEFDAAQPYFEDGEIDLLHIDGLHTYDAVAHDFENWRPRLSERAVVIFHDINVRERDFGVWRLWKELAREFPHFAFNHGYGLGVLGVGPEVPQAMQRLFALSTRDSRADGSADAIRISFASRGESVLTQFHLLQTQELVHREAARAEQECRRTEQERARADQETARAEALDLEREAARAEVERERERVRAAQRESEARASALRVELDGAAEEGNRLRALSAKHAAQTAQREAQLAEAMREIERLHGREQIARARLGELETAVARLVRRTIAFRVKRLQRSIRKRLPGFLRDRWLRSSELSLLPAPELAQSLALIQHKASQDAQRTINVAWIGGEPDTPGYRYRVLNWADAARAIGANVTHMRIDEWERHAGDIESAHVVVLWRAKWDERTRKVHDLVRKGGGRLIFDVDDLMFDPRFARAEVIDGIRSHSFSEREVANLFGLMRQSAASCDLCMATTLELADHFRAMDRPTFVMPNGFDQAILETSRLAVRRRRAQLDDGLLRIGYAGGSKTHQHDFAVCASAVAQVLREHPEARLVVFRDKLGASVLDVTEFPEFGSLCAQIEWRELVPLAELPNEIARFDINLAPLEVGNPFCEAKSELKYFEAALVDVCTVASPTGPYRRAIEDGRTGRLATTAAEWHAALSALVASPAQRRALAREALRDVLWTFGPQRRADLVASMLEQALGGRSAARAFALDALRHGKRTPRIAVYKAEIVLEHDRCIASDVTVVVPLHNYERFIVEALNSVAAQTLPDLDLVIVNDASTDASLDKALEWARSHKQRFNRLLVLSNARNVKLGPTRNVGFDAAETPYVLLLDADNRLRPPCLEACLRAMRESGAAYVYPRIQAFGEANYVMGAHPYDALRFVGGNYVDAMALISKGAWCGAGGYENVPYGWEDYEFWCRIAELGLTGAPVGGEPVAEYRVHGASMLNSQSNVERNHRVMVSYLKRRHPWLSIVWKYQADLDAERLGGAPAQVPAPASSAPLTSDARGRLDLMLAILRCPQTGQALELVGESELRTADGSRRWSVVDGHPYLFPGLAHVEKRPVEHISNPPPEELIERMRSTPGLVLNVSAGGTPQRLDNVIEAEVALFRHTDLIADAHCLPFADASFEGVVSLNAFEHYHDPVKAAAEMRRVLKPGGWIYVRTAFLQPQHEAPWHFFNCTKYGLMKWFEGFESSRLQVSDNFNPSYSLSWIAAEAESALRRDVSEQAAQAFMREPMGSFVRYWREEATRSQPVWKAFEGLSQESQEVLSAGFEFVGRKPLD